MWTTLAKWLDLTSSQAIHQQMRLVCAQAIRVLNMIKVFGKPIRVNKSSQDKRAADVGANLFIGNLDPDVDEKVCTLWASHS